MLCEFECSNAYGDEPPTIDMTLPSGRPQMNVDTPGPTLAVLAIFSTAISAVVAGSAVAWQLKHQHLEQMLKTDLPRNLMYSLEGFSTDSFASRVYSAIDLRCCTGSVWTGISYQPATIRGHDHV